MLEIKDLEVSYGSLKILNGIDLCLEKGESLAVIGESGAGKTTLGLSIMGLLDGCSGQILLNGRDILSLGEEERRKMRGNDMAMVFQNVEDVLDPIYSISNQIVEAILVHGGERAFATRRTHLLLRSVGLDEDKGHAYPHELSGGERQRSLIAMAMANDPEVLVLDEPTASLDAITKAAIIKLLREVARDKTVLVVTHDLSTAAKLTDKTAVLYAGRVVELGPTTDLMEMPRHPYTRGLIRSSPNMTTTKDLQGIPGRMAYRIGGCPFHARCTQRIGRCSDEVPALVDLGGRLIACHRGGIVPLLEAKGLRKCFSSTNAVDGVDFTLYEGETLALVGESGSGKTTLSKMIIGLVEPDGGEIHLEGEPLKKRTKEFYDRVQMIYQNPKESISHRMNVLEAIEEPLDIHNVKNEKVDRIRRVLEEVELSGDDNFLRKYPHELSGGEAQRVAIARALVLGPKLLLADEPTSALDASIQAKILKLLLNLQEKRGLTILFVTHDIALARKVSDRMAVMLKGRIVEEGPTNEVITNPVHQYTKKLIEIAPDLRCSTTGELTCRAAKPGAVTERSRDKCPTRHTLQDDIVDCG
ncbi:MAG: ABC transporter ATP-binding protein [Methanotrichaceae archaeon]